MSAPTSTKRREKTEPQRFTAYICNPEFCDDAYHVEEPVAFEAFRFEGDLEEYRAFDENTYLIPLNEGQVTMGYRMPCRSWFDHKRPKGPVVICGTCDAVFIEDGVSAEHDYEIHIQHREACSIPSEGAAE